MQMPGVDMAAKKEEMKKAAEEKAQKEKAEQMEKIEKELGEKAPFPAPLFFTCCGGPVGTLKSMEFLVPGDQKEAVKSSISAYEAVRDKEIDIP